MVGQTQQGDEFRHKKSPQYPVAEYMDVRAYKGYFTFIGVPGQQRKYGDRKQGNIKPATPESGAQVFGGVYTTYT